MWPLKRGSIHMTFSMKGQERDDLLIQVTAWAGLTLHGIHVACFNNVLSGKFWESYAYNMNEN